MKRVLTSIVLAIAPAAALGQQVTVREGTNIAVTAAPDQSSLIMDLQGSLWMLPFRGGTAKQITDPLLEPARPDYSPKGGLIAFEAYKGGTFHIWTIHPDGSGLKQITTGHGDDREPRVSPDGTRIAFSSDRAFEGSYDIWVVEIATGKVARRTSAPADEYEPAWSADGKEIAFVSGAGINGTTIRAINDTGQERTLATAPAGARLNSPSFAPDGNRVAYEQFAANKSLLMVSGKPVGKGDDVFPFPATWLPGDRLLYAGNGGIHIANLETGRTEDIPFEAQFTLQPAALSPQTVRFRFQGFEGCQRHREPGALPQRQASSFRSSESALAHGYRRQAAAAHQRQVLQGRPGMVARRPRIAYSSDKAGTEDLYVMDVATGSEKRVTAFANSAEVAAAWSPDGKMLAYQDEAGATYTLDLASGARKRIAAALFAPSKPSWSADGRTIAIGALKAYTRRFREGTSQILTVDLATGRQTFTEPAPFKSLSTRGEDGPLYSPDGKSVAFVMDSLLWIRPVDANGVPTGVARQVNHEVTDAPTWSGDSKQLLYLSNGKLRMIGADGSNPRSVPLDLTWRNEDIGAAHHDPRGPPLGWPWRRRTVPMSTSSSPTEESSL